MKMKIFGRVWHLFFQSPRVILPHFLGKKFTRTSALAFLITREFNNVLLLHIDISIDSSFYFSTGRAVSPFLTREQCCGYVFKFLDISFVNYGTMVTGSSITWTRQMPHCSFTWQPTTSYKSCTSLARLNLRAVSVPVIQQRVLLYHSRVQEPPATSFTSFPNQPWSHGAQVEGEDEMKIYPSCIITWNISD